MPPNGVTKSEAAQRKLDFEAIKALLPSQFDFKGHLYKPHGKYESCMGKIIRSKDPGHLLGSALSSSLSAINPL
jgi:hypothetical protein